MQTGQLLPPSRAGPSTGPQTSSQACGGQGAARRVSAFSQGQASRVLLDTKGGGGGLTEGSRGWAAQPLSNQRGKRPRLEPASGSGRGTDCTRVHARTRALRPPREWPVGPLPTPPASATLSLTRGSQPLSEPGSACPPRAPLSSTFRTRAVELGTAGTRSLRVEPCAQGQPGRVAGPRSRLHAEHV